MKRTIGTLGVLVLLGGLGALVPSAPAALPQQAGVLDLAAPGAGAIKLAGSAGSWSGASVAGAGDVNGDGVGDLVVGAPHAGASNSGVAYVVFGPVTGNVSLANLAGRGFTIQGAENADFLGQSVAGIGDFNGDGKSDVAVGTPGAGTPSNNPPGIAYVVFGKTDTAAVNVGALGAGGLTVTGPQDGAVFGRSVAGVPDMNGDGRPELGVAATSFNSGNGAASGGAWVVYSGASGTLSIGGGLSPAQGINYSGAAANLNAGFGLAGLPDLNGDGRGELAAGVVGASASEGAAITSFGQSPGATVTLGAALGFTAKQPGSNDIGQSLAALSDQNGDGLADLLIGSRGVHAYGGRANAGQAFVAFGRANASPDLNAGGGYEIGGAAAGDRAGYSVADLGDVNAAGGADFAITAPCASPGGRTTAGSAYVVFRNTAHTGIDLASLVLDGAGFRVDGPQASGGCPDAAIESDMTVGGAGDVTGDGRPDLLIGTPKLDEGGTDDGAAWIVLGYGAPAFAYPASGSGRVGDALVALAPSAVQRTGAATFTVNPPLPAGLSLNPANGVLSGTPTAAAPSAAYTVNMSDLAGTTSRQVTLAIAPPASPPDPRHYPKLNADADAQVQVSSKTFRGSVYSVAVKGISDKQATLRYRCVKCSGPSSRRSITVKAPLTSKRLRKALAKAKGAKVTRLSAIEITVTKSGSIGYWVQFSYKAKKKAKKVQCIPVGKSKPQKSCPTLIPE